MTFKKLKLIEPLQQALSDLGYQVPTAIQKKAIPLVLKNKDIIGCAQTGTGKTAAFALPLLQQLYLNKQKGDSFIKSLILSPTRELAAQIGDSIKAYGKYTGIRHAVIFGGVSQFHQEIALKKGVDILVATPGRLIDLVGQGVIDLMQVESFILDEADRMLDMGFIHDINKILQMMPQKKQSMLFSATMPKQILSLSKTFLHKPVSVTVTPVSSAVDRIDQTVYFVEQDKKRSLLFHLLEDESIVSALVFTRTKHGADKITRRLFKSGIKSEAIHGNKSQAARIRALDKFKKKKIRVLVATDIAARGIDVDELSHVINYDLPEVPETYVHRIGRTARAGLDGTAISFCNFSEKKYLNDIHKLISQKIVVVEDHPFLSGEDVPDVQEKKFIKQVQTKEVESKKTGFVRRRKKRSGRKVLFS